MLDKRSMKTGKMEASFTVFFALAFLSITVFFLALLYGGNHSILTTRGRKAADISAHSVLAEYDRAIEKKYGLYCICDREQAETDLLYYLGKNISGCQGIGLFPCALEEVKLKTEGSLGEAETIKEQIRQFMKKRILLSWLDEWKESLEFLKEKAGQMNSTTEQWDRLEQYNELYIQLVELLDGLGRNGEKSSEGINDFRTENEIADLWRQAKGKADQPDFLQKCEKELIKRLQEGERNYQQAAQLLAELEQTARSISGQQLPLEAEEIAELKRKADEKNNQLIQIEEAWQRWRENPQDGEKGAGLDAKIRTVSEMGRIELSYSVIQEGKESINLKKLWKSITGKEKDAIEGYAPDRQLLEEGSAVLAALPSKGAEESKGEDAWEALMKSIQQELGNLGEVLTNRLYFAEYACGMLKSYPETVAQKAGEEARNLRLEEKKKGFFENELEYILSGQMNEYQNVKAVRRKLIGIRTILNMAALLKDEEKCALIRITAQGTGGILVPGIGEQVAYALILTGWSLWEAKEDWNCLAKGEKVPLLKSAEDWKTDLDSLLNQESADEEKSSENGLTYQRYAGFLLYLLPEDTLIKRIQDLIYLERGGAVPIDQFITDFSIQGTLRAGGQSYALSGAYQY